MSGKKGKGDRNPKQLDGKRVKFTKTNQPSGAAKSAGWAKKRKGQELAKAILDVAFRGAENSQLKKDASEYFGVPQKHITVEMMLLFRQAQKAIQSADTNAFKAVMERAHGLPKQNIGLSSNDVVVKLTSKKKNDSV